MAICKDPGKAPKVISNRNYQAVFKCVEKKEKNVDGLKGEWENPY